MDDAILKQLGMTLTAKHPLDRPTGSDDEMCRARRLLTAYPPEADGRARVLVVVPHRPPRWDVLRPPVSTVGRLPGSGIVVEDPEISRLHCKFVFDGDFWHIEDVGSRNGVHYHNVRIDHHCLRHGDLLRLGGVCLLFHDGAAARIAQLG